MSSRICLPTQVFSSQLSHFTSYLCASRSIRPTNVGWVYKQYGKHQNQILKCLRNGSWVNRKKKKQRLCQATRVPLLHFCDGHKSFQEWPVEPPPERKHTQWLKTELACVWYLTITVGDPQASIDRSSSPFEVALEHIWIPQTKSSPFRHKIRICNSCNL